MRCEHRPDARHHDVEAVVGERHCFRVRLDPVQLGAALGGDGAAGLEELGRQVARGHYCARLSRWDGGVAGSGGDVQDTLSGPDVTGPDQPWPELGDQLRGHGRVIARRP